MEGFPFVAQIRVRFAETDAQGIGEHAFENEVGARNHQRRDEREGGRRRIGGNAELLWLELGPSLQHDPPSMLTMPLDADCRAE